ncbi:MAG: aldehyde dehydrogenase family protein [Pseudomonadota bacterium]
MQNQKPSSEISRQIERARVAMEHYENTSQERVDEAVTAIAWSLYKPEHAKLLAEMAVAKTGLGNVDSKIIKNRRKTFGTLRDLMRVKTVGMIEDNPQQGLVKYAKPVGVVGAVTPSTNPSATPVNKAMMALKGGNSVIIAPSPAAFDVSKKTVEFMRRALTQSGHPEDLVQILSPPISKESTGQLIEHCDLCVVTGSQNNVRRAMSSGTVTIAVGAGNVPVIIDKTADLDDAAQKITKSKTFDNATSCSSENALIIVDEIYRATLQALKKCGAYLANENEKLKIKQTLWQNGQLNRHAIAKDASVLANLAGLGREARSANYFLVEEEKIEPHSFADEKLSLILTIYRARDFNEAKDLCKQILKIKGIGHSVGIHSHDEQHIDALAREIDVVRVLVNQAHTFGNGGSFDNALPFTLSMGCGTWAGNSISENLNWKHFVNITHLVKTIAPDQPSEDSLFAKHWDKYGR